MTGVGDAAAQPQALHRTLPAPRHGAAEDAAFLQALGLQLRTLRARRGMTRRDLARQSRVSERFLAQLESGRGNGSVLLLRDLAHALGVRTPDLLPDAATRPAERALIEGLLDRLGEADLQAARALLVARFGGTPVDARRRRIALIGLRGAGKSTLGRMLAEERGVRFFELDREVEREAGMELREIFELHGQRGFRGFERAALLRLFAEAPDAVIAAGGSIVAEPATYELLLSTCFVVWIRASPEQHMQRVQNQGDLRPMQDTRQAMDDLRAILASREALYGKADATIDTSAQSPAESLKTLSRLVQ